MMQGGKEFTSPIIDSKTQEPSNSIEERLYDAYEQSGIIEINPMLEKKRNSLTPLKRNVSIIIAFDSLTYT